MIIAKTVCSECEKAERSLTSERRIHAHIKSYEWCAASLWPVTRLRSTIGSALRNPWQIS